MNDPIEIVVCAWRNGDYDKLIVGDYLPYKLNHYADGVHGERMNRTLVVSQAAYDAIVVAGISTESRSTPRYGSVRVLVDGVEFIGMSSVEYAQ